MKGFRLLSNYQTGKGQQLWIITEADRSATTGLAPERVLTATDKRNEQRGCPCGMIRTVIQPGSNIRSRFTLGKHLEDYPCREVSLNCKGDRFSLRRQLSVSEPIRPDGHYSYTVPNEESFALVEVCLRIPIASLRSCSTWPSTK